MKMVLKHVVQPKEIERNHAALQKEIKKGNCSVKHTNILLAENGMTK